MTGKLTMKYWWQCEDFKRIPKELEVILHKAAQDRIMEKFREGYVSGELFEYINIDIKGRKTPVEGWACSGWWDIK